MPFLGSLKFREGSALTKEQGLSWLREQLQLRSGKDALQSVRTESSGSIEVQTIQQLYKGIKVEHGRVKMASQNNAVSFMQLEFYPIPDNIATAPSISSDQALQKAMDAVGAVKYVWQGYTGNDPAYQKPIGELVYVQDIYNKIGQLCLAYKFSIEADVPISKSYIYVNAVNGEIVFSDQIIKHANATGTADTRYSGNQSFIADNTGTNFRLRSQKNGDSIITVNYQRLVQSSANDLLAVDFTDNDNNWTAAEFDNANYDNAALDVQWGLQKVSDYWNLVRGRAGWNNAHGPMKSYIHVRVSASAGYDNAYWSGAAMFYGDGTYLTGNANGFRPLTSLDVTAHELGHAVCQTTAGLVYQRESGGLNEGFSDIWGAAVEHYSGLGGFKQNFKIGEEISPNQSTGFLRDMQNPNAGNQPDTYFGTLWYPTTLGGCPVPNSNTNDNCGVHYNSGVINKWFYILVQGESGTNDNGDTYNVTGLSWAKAEQITYLTELNLTPNSDYAATRTASINAATTLYGACSNEVRQVTNAWFAVGVGASANCNPAIEFVKAISTVTEGTGTTNGCISKTYNVPVKLGTAASATINLTFSTAGTAVNGVHYSLSPATLTFSAGETGTKNMAITILDNATVDGNKTLVLNYLLNANGGTGVAGVNNQTHTITITDDDAAPTSIIAPPLTNLVTLINENFDTTTTALPVGWVSGTFSGGTSVNNWVLGPNGGAGITGNAAYISNNATTEPLAYTNTSATDRILITKSFSTTNIKNLKLKFRYKVEGEYYTAQPASIYDYGRIMYSVNGTSFSFVNDSITNAPLILYGKGTAATDTTISLPPAIANLPTVYIGFRWTNDIADGNNPPLLIDEVLITGRSTRAAVEVSANQITASNVINGNYSSYLYNGSDSLLVARVANLSQNIGCVNAGVTVSGNGQRTINSGTATYLATQKVIRISPVTANTTATYTGTLYFTAAELAIWGASATSLKILKVKDGVPLNAVLDFTNSKLIIPSSVVDNSATTGVIAYTGDFTGFSQFLLTEAGTILPIKLTDFTVALKEKDALLNWQTEQEFNNKGFDIMRSLDGVNFVKIGFVGGNGSSNIPVKYSFTDVNIPANITVYYRLRQVDLDNKATLSQILSVKLSDKNAFSSLLWPNPAVAEVNISFNNSIKNGTITVIDQQGRKLLTKTISQPTLKTTLRTSALAAGTYLVQIQTENKTETQKLLIKRN